MTKEEAIDKAMNIIADHRYDGDDCGLMEDIGNFIEEIYEEVINYGNRKNVEEVEEGST